MLTMYDSNQKSMKADLLFSDSIVLTQVGIYCGPISFLLLVLCLLVAAVFGVHDFLDSLDVLRLGMIGQCG